MNRLNDLFSFAVLHPKKLEMTKRDFKDSIYSELAKITKALANPHRLEIIELLAQGEFSVEQIATQTNLPIANASQHLQVLKSAQLVDINRQGNFIHYRLSNINVFKTWKALRELGVERIASIEKIVNDFRQSKFTLESVTINQLVGKIESGKVTIVDVRPEAEYNKGHIANSISIPIDQLAKRLQELPKRNQIIAYCRGPFCVFADEAVALLTKAGYKATRLEEGFPDWHLEGLPVEVSMN
ncbi:MAG TPA: metalloregulator ArsR/SmtB family transcription factor [Chryseolinea sp.]|nr:metalloregulator ArsR/SmtB family transcription factor [Chryseolinea sp.]